MTVEIGATVGNGNKVHRTRGGGSQFITGTPVVCGKVATGTVQRPNGRPVRVTCRGCQHD